jgi:hypothetical protein
MKRIVLLFIPIALYFFSATSCIKDRVQPASSGGGTLGSRQLIHYWNFNSTDTTTISVLVPNFTIGGGAITDVASYYDVVTPGSILNARNGDTAGNGLRMRNPYTSMTLILPTTGYTQPILTFAVESSASGPTGNTISYTLDGTTFINTGLAVNEFSIDTSWTEYSIDFSAISGANDNPNFAIQFTTTNNNTGTSGNDRYDNITLDAYKQ